MIGVKLDVFFYFIQNIFWGIKLVMTATEDMNLKNVFTYLQRLFDSVFLEKKNQSNHDILSETKVETTCTRYM